MVPFDRDALLRAAGSPLSKANAVSQSMLCTTLDWRPLSRLACTYTKCQGDTHMLRSAAYGDPTVAPV